jgi:hypothetical protein
VDRIKIDIGQTIDHGFAAFYHHAFEPFTPKGAPPVMPMIIIPGKRLFYLFHYDKIFNVKNIEPVYIFSL